MVKKETKPKRKRTVFRVSEEVKLEIVKERHLEGKSSKEIAKNHGLYVTTINKILRKFAAEKDKSALLMKRNVTDSKSEEIKLLREEVMELEKRLYSEKMRADFYDTMIDVAEEMFNIEIRKKAGTGQSKGCTKTK